MERVIIRILTIAIGFLLGTLAQHYLTGVYKILFEISLVTGIITFIIYYLKNYKEERGEN